MEYLKGFFKHFKDHWRFWLLFVLFSLLTFSLIVKVHVCFVFMVVFSPLVAWAAMKWEDKANLKKL